MTTTAVRLALVWVAASIVASCAPRPDLNTPCTLVKKNPDQADPKKSLFITAGEIRANAARDVISFGSVQCEDLICIRPGGSELPANDADPVQGFCSRACIETGQNQCPSNDENLDKNPDTALSCRQLLLDEDVLANIKQNDPENYKRWFGDTTTATFCARKNTATPPAQ